VDVVRERHGRRGARRAALARRGGCGRVEGRARRRGGRDRDADLPAAPPTARFDRARVEADGDRAVVIGAEGADADVLQRGERLRRRVPVLVARSDRGDREAGSCGPEEVRVLVIAPVVRHLEHVGVQVVAAVEQRPLRLRLHVAGEQQGQPPGGDHPEDDRVVVLVGTRAREGVTRREHGQGQRTDIEPLPRRDPCHVDPCRASRVADLGDGGRVAVPAEKQASDGPGPEHAGQPADVIQVHVRQDEASDLSHAEVSQARRHHGRIRAGVHNQGGRAIGSHDEPVALADVTCDHRPAGRRPGPKRRHQRAGAHHGEHRHGRGYPASARADETATQEDRGTAADGPRHSGRPADRRPGQPGCHRRDQDQPPRRQPRAPRENDGHRVADRRDDGRQRARDGGERDRPLGGRVREYGHEAELAEQGSEQRRAGKVRGQRDGEHLGPPARESGRERVAPARRDRHYRTGRQHRQREARRHGKLRREQHERVDGRRERGQRGTRPPGEEREEGHDPHDGGAQNAGRRTGHDDERDDAQRNDHDAGAPTTTCARHQREQRRQHDCEVRAGNGDEVRHPDRAKIVAQLRIQAGRVADDDPRDQPALGCGQARDGGTQPRAHAARHPLLPRRLADQVGRPARQHDGSDRVPRIARRKPADGVHALPWQERQPRPHVVGEEHHGSPQPVRRVRRDLHELRRHDSERSHGRGGEVRVGGHDDGHRHARLPGG
jgi:hypothetical protein